MAAKAKERKLTWLLAAMLVLFTSSAALASIPRANTNPPLDRWAIFDELAAVPQTPDNIDLDNEILLREAVRTALPPVGIGPILPETHVWAFEVFDEISRPVPDELSRAVRQAYAGLVPRFASDRTVISPDPMGYRDSSNLYAFAGGDPVNGRDPTGKLSKTQLAFLIRMANRGQKGNFGEVALEKLLRRHGRIVLEGPSTGKGVYEGGADIIAFNPERGELEIWDNKYFTGNSGVSSAPTLTRPERRAANIARAQALIRQSALPQSVKVEMLAAISSNKVKWLVGNSGAFNRVRHITERLKEHGIEFGSRSYIARTGKFAGSLTKIAKGVLPLASIAFALPALKASADEDRFFQEMLLGCDGCDAVPWEVEHASFLEQLGAIAGEEAGGEVGCIVGGAIGGLLGIETGPGALITGFGGCVAGGIVGDELGGAAGRKAVEELLLAIQE